MGDSLFFVQSEYMEDLNMVQNAVNDIKIEKARLDERSKSAENRAEELK